jgi:tetratricopeptide (TPR) repeat protein
VIDSLEDRALDSAYTNAAFSRRLLAERLPHITDSADYYRLITVYGKTLFTSADYDSALYYFGRVKRFFERHPHYPTFIKNGMLADVYNTEGNIQMGLGNADSATVLFTAAYRYCQQSHRVNLLADLCINLADAWSNVSRYDLTSLYYRRALFLCDSLQLPQKQKIPIYYGLGHTYMSLYNFTLSDLYFNMADSLLPLMNTGERFTYFNNRGNSYYYRKEYATALKYMRRAFGTVQPYPHLIYQQQLAKANLGELFLLEGKLDSARIYIDDSYRYFNGIGYRPFAYYLHMLQLSLAIKSQQMNQAREILRQTAQDKQMSLLYANVRSQYLQQYYQQTGNYREAYRLLQENARHNDSVRNDRLLAQLSEIEMRYRQDTTLLHRDIRINEQQARIEASRLYQLLWIAGCLLLAVGLVFLVWLGRKKRELLTRRYHEQFVHTRMESLRRNVSPHFIFNILGHELHHFSGQEEVSNRLFNLIQYLRQSLQSTNCVVVPLQDELFFVDEFVRWSTQSFDEDFHYLKEVDERIDAKEFQVLSMIVQIPVENAIKHGLRGLTGDKRLAIRVHPEGEGIRIEVIDNGRGYLPGRQSSEGTGTGMKVINQSIFLLNQHNKEGQISFEIRGNNPGTYVSIYIPTVYNYTT